MLSWVYSRPAPPIPFKFCQRTPAARRGVAGASCQQCGIRPTAVIIRQAAACRPRGWTEPLRGPPQGPSGFLILPGLSGPRRRAWRSPAWSARRSLKVSVHPTVRVHHSPQLFLTLCPQTVSCFALALKVSLHVAEALDDRLDPVPEARAGQYW